MHLRHSRQTDGFARLAKKLIVKLVTGMNGYYSKPFVKHRHFVISFEDIV